MADDKRHYTVVTIEWVRHLIKEGVPFTCRYEFVGTGSRGIPKYQCHYEANGEKGILCLSRLSVKGATPREFDIWPGLLKHHREFGDGRILCYRAEDHEIELFEQSELDALKKVNKA